MPKKKVKKLKWTELSRAQKRRLYGSSKRDRMKPDIVDKKGKVLKKGFEKGVIGELSHSDQDAFHAFMRSPDERPSSKGYRSRQWERGNDLYRTFTVKGEFKSGISKSKYDAYSGADKRRIKKLMRQGAGGPGAAVGGLAGTTVGGKGSKENALYEKGKKYTLDSRGGLKSEKFHRRGLTKGGKGRRDARIKQERAALKEKYGFGGSWAKLHGPTLPGVKESIRQRISGGEGQNILQRYDPSVFPHELDIPSAQAALGGMGGLVSPSATPPLDASQGAGNISEMFGPEPGTIVFKGATPQTVDGQRRFVLGEDAQDARRLTRSNPAFQDISITDPTVTGPTLPGQPELWHGGTPSRTPAIDEIFERQELMGPEMVDPFKNDPLRRRIPPVPSYDDRIPGLDELYRNRNLFRGPGPNREEEDSLFDRMMEEKGRADQMRLPPLPDPPPPGPPPWSDPAAGSMLPPGDPGKRPLTKEERSENWMRQNVPGYGNEQWRSQEQGMVPPDSPGPFGLTTWKQDPLYQNRRDMLTDPSKWITWNQDPLYQNRRDMLTDPSKWMTWNQDPLYQNRRDMLTDPSRWGELLGEGLSPLKKYLEGLF